MCWVRGVRYMDAWERDACVRVGRSRGWRAAWETDAVRARVGGERDAGGKMRVCFVCVLCVRVCVRACVRVCFVCMLCVCALCVCAVCVCFVRVLCACALCVCFRLCGWCFVWVGPAGGSGALALGH